MCLNLVNSLVVSRKDASLSYPSDPPSQTIVEGQKKISSKLRFTYRIWVLYHGGGVALDLGQFHSCTA